MGGHGAGGQEKEDMDEEDRSRRKGGQEQEDRE